MSINNSNILKIFKHYMGQYFVKPDIQLYKLYQRTISETPNNVLYCTGTRYVLHQCGLAYLDYQEAYKQHTQIYSYDLLNSFLHLTEDTYSQVFYEYPSYPLIIYHPTGTTDNQRLLSLITHVYSYRHLKNQKTLILSESNILNQIIDKVTPITDLSSIHLYTDDLYD